MRVALKQMSILLNKLPYGRRKLVDHQMLASASFEIFRQEPIELVLKLLTAHLKGKTITLNIKLRKLW